MDAVVELLLYLDGASRKGRHWAAVYNRLGGRTRAENAIADGVVAGYVRVNSDTALGTMVVITRRGMRAANRFRRVGFVQR